MHIRDAEGQKKKSRIERLASVGALMIVLSFASMFLAFVGGFTERLAVVITGAAFAIVGAALYYFGHGFKGKVTIGFVTAGENQSVSAPHSLLTFKSTEIQKQLIQGLSNLNAIRVVSIVLAVVLAIVIATYLAISEIEFSFSQHNLLSGIIVACASALAAFFANTGVYRYEQLIEFEKNSSDHIAVSEHGLRIFVGIISGTGLFGGPDLKNYVLSIAWDEVDSFEVRGQSGAGKNISIPIWWLEVRGHSEPIRIERRLIGKNERELISVIATRLKKPVILKDELYG
jgi:protein-S-isoprenylcysteine O-methyltransferase Ste14